MDTPPCPPGSNDIRQAIISNHNTAAVIVAVRDQQLVGATISGHAVIVSEGTIEA
jgi:hypothetical protein